MSDIFQNLRANHNRKDSKGKKKRPDPTSESTKLRKRLEIYERVTTFI